MCKRTGALLPFAAASLAGTGRPNVLVIAVAGLRDEPGYGAAHIQSPHINSLAARELLFDRAYWLTQGNVVE